MTALMTQAGDAGEADPPASPEVPRRTGGTGTRLLRFALANLTRRPERFVLSTLGIALAIMVVVVVRTISIGFAGAGTASLSDVLGSAPLWVVPAQGVHYDSRLSAILPGGPAPPLAAPPGWTAQQTIAGSWATGHGRLALYGRPGVPGGRAEVGAAAARVLGVSGGQRIRVGGQALTVEITGTSRIVTVAPAAARRQVGGAGWWTVRPPGRLAGQLTLGHLLSAATGIPSSTDPAVRAGPHGLIYDTVGGGGSLTFQQRFSALFSGKVTGSVLGLVSTVGLILGFVIAVTSFLASVQERRREFGIMASIGLADEILYFFLVESAVIFVAAYALGALAAGAAVLVLAPGVASAGAWLQAAALAAAYLPAMAILGALVPVHRLLQQRPVTLLAGAS
jgi:ABC-type antimicrobial peptide transport system permease subunit